jgi:hypothetical protein
MNVEIAFFPETAAHTHQSIARDNRQKIATYKTPEVYILRRVAYAITFARIR